MLSTSTRRNGDFGLLQSLVDLISDPQKDACGSTEDVGGNWDFGFLDGVWTICLDNLRSPKASKNCLVYSFGIGNDWSFDDAMHDAGCEVYSFDPTINKPSHKRSDRHWFYDWGLVTDVPYIRKEWTLLTFEEIRERLGHKKWFIDVVKMDVEGAEWRFLDSSTAVFDNIGQLTLEIHPFRHIKQNRTIEIAAERLSLLKRLRTELDMKLFHVRKNPAALDLVALSNFSWFTNLTPAAYQKEILYELSFVRI
ncbi:hypothetical protein RvY_07291-2 [Ramazzottius varieornatus]|uniref:Methyltransferase domain-containing protein n=1 Tax=Ramazzottius varieornatus TaxID=947166 RepID=A0A1D1V7S0_RAMVA|nr:hypothetical protein RvY_07291-2 [Ramazzottius varieornatus]